MPHLASSLTLVVRAMLALCVASPILLAGAAEAVSQRDRALQLAREGRCPAALPELEAVLAAAPDDAEAGLVAGQCLVRTQQYEQAIPRLEAARSADPGLSGVDVTLAIAHYHAEQPEAAREALARAEARDPDRASVQLYRGLLLLDDAEQESGVLALQRASEIDPGYAEPVSSFYQGVALSGIDVERARAALGHVVIEWPGTSWADEAQRALDRLEEPGFKWWVEGSIGVEYDTNVVLRGSGVELPDQISDEEDWRGVWTLSGGSTLYQDESWTLGLMGSYYGTRQHDVTKFDTHYPTASLWVDRALGDSTTARFRYEYGFAWVNEESYLSRHFFEGAVFQGFEDWGQTRLDLRYSRNDFRFDTGEVEDGSGTPGSGCPSAVACGPPGLNEASARNRDGWEVGAGILHVLPLPDAIGLEQLSARAGYDYSWYDSRGREYSYQQHGFTLGSTAMLPGELFLDVEASFLYRPYQDPTTFPDRTPDDGTEYGLDSTNKREREWLVGASLSRALTEHLSLVFSWRYDDNDSTSAVFDYDRHVVGLRLEGRLAP